MSPKTKEFTERINVFFKPEQLERIKSEADIRTIYTEGILYEINVEVLETNE